VIEFDDENEDWYQERGGDVLYSIGTLRKLSLRLEVPLRSTYRHGVP
jgi:hypothetical protein